MSRKEAVAILFKIIEIGILNKNGKNQIETIIKIILAEEEGLNLWTK